MKIPYLLIDTMAYSFHNGHWALFRLDYEETNLKSDSIWRWAGAWVVSECPSITDWPEKKHFPLLMIFLYLSPPVQNEWAVLLVKIDECSG